MRKVLVVGASGATGKLLVADLLEQNIEVVAIVRSSSALKSTFKKYSNYCEILANITDISDIELSSHLAGCDAVFSCLGHNLNLRGIFGAPRRLVTDSIQKISRVIESFKQDKKVKMILMNTAGNANRDIPEKPPLLQRIVILIVRLLIPPHVDNEKAADFLRINIGKNNNFIEWVVVRPDSLIDKEKVTDYEVHPSPIRNVIFNPGTTSRINVANFMANLSIKSDLWNIWKGKMPVIYNSSGEK